MKVVILACDKYTWLVPVFMHFYGLKGMKKLERTKDLAGELGTSQSTIAKIKSSIGKKLQGQ